MTFLQVINSQCGDSKLQRKVSNHKLRLFYVMSILQSVSVQYDSLKVVDTKYSTNKVAVSQYTSKVYRVLNTHNFADSSSLYKSMYVVVTVKVSSSLYDDALSTELFFLSAKLSLVFKKMRH